MKKALGLVGAALLTAAPAFAAEVPQGYNCDYQPSCEVAPGIYGKMYSPVKSKFNLSIGGYVKLDYAYNSVNLGPSGSISPFSGAIPSKATNTAQAAVQDQSILSARQSRIWFKVDGPTLLGAKTGSLIEADFYGDPSAATESPMLRMRLAYATMDWANTQVLFGQAYDMFAPMIASTQDFRSGAPYGAPNSPRIPQLRLTQKVNLTPNNQLKFAFAVEDPNQFGNNQAAPSTPTGVNTTIGPAYGPDVNYNGQVSFVSKALGVSPGYFGMSRNPLTVTFFGQYGTEKSASNNNHHIDTWGYGVYTFVPLLRSANGMDRTGTLSLEAQGYKAANMAYNAATATTVTGTTAGVVSNVNNAAGNQSPAKSVGAIAQLMFYPTQSLGLVGGWGSRYAYDITSYRGFSTYQRQSQMVFGNVTYDLNAAVRVAAEYQNLKTVYGNANGVAGRKVVGDDNTYRLCAYYFF